MPLTRMNSDSTTATTGRCSIAVINTPTAPSAHITRPTIKVSRTESRCDARPAAKPNSM